MKNVILTLVCAAVLMWACGSPKFFFTKIDPTSTQKYPQTDKVELFYSKKPEKKYNDVYAVTSNAFMEREQAEWLDSLIIVAKKEGCNGLVMSPREYLVNGNAYLLNAVCIIYTE